MAVRVQSFQSTAPVSHTHQLATAHTNFRGRKQSHPKSILVNPEKKLPCVKLQPTLQQPVPLAATAINPQRQSNTDIMSHESVWNSRPRSYGKGARGWYVASAADDLPPPG